MTGESDGLAELRTTVRAAAAGFGGQASVLRLEHGQRPARDERAWDVLSSQIGVSALGLPEPAGGIGGLAEILVVAEELGAALLPVPFLSSTVMAGQVLAGCGAPALTALADIANGVVATVVGAAYSGGSHTLSCDRDGLVVGHADGVLDALGATWLVVAADDKLFLVDAEQPCVRVSPVESLDLSRPMGRVDFDKAAAQLISTDAAAALESAWSVIALAIAAEQLGGAQRCLDQTVEYVNARRQFGRPVGSFQAVKHTLADVLVQVEMSRSALARALDAESDQRALREAALVARIWCSDAFRFATAEAVQLHGGIGFTWEHFAHLYFRRARADALLLGNVADAREALAAHLEW